MSVTQSCLFATPWTVAHQAPLSMEYSNSRGEAILPYHCPPTLSSPGMTDAGPSDDVKKIYVNYPFIIITSAKMWDQSFLSIPYQHVRLLFWCIFPFCGHYSYLCEWEFCLYKNVKEKSVRFIPPVYSQRYPRTPPALLEYHML